jgi:hypothetical protein
MEGQSATDSQVVRIVTTDFDEDFASLLDWARVYRSVRLQVVPAMEPKPEPAQWKRPALATWRDHEYDLVDDEKFCSWFERGGASRQIGVICGAASGNLMVIDLDTYKGPEAMNWYGGLLAAHNNAMPIETWSQITGGGGRQLFFECPQNFVPPTGKNNVINVDVRGQGGFAMIPPSNHTSGKPYCWEEGCAPWDIPLAIAPDWLCDALRALFGEGKAHKSASTPSAPSPTPVAPLHTPGSVFDTRMNDGREAYMARVVWAAVLDLYRAAPIKPLNTDAEMRAAYATYEQGVRTKDPRKSLDDEGRGWKAFCVKWHAAMAQWDTEVATQAAEHPPHREVPQSPFAPAPSPPVGLFNAKPFVARDPTTLPPRQFVYGKHLIRKFASATVAPGGLGKTALTIVEALAMTSGKPLLQVSVKKPLRVWLYNGEDPMDELDRRVAGAIKHYDLTADDLGDRLFVNSGRDYAVVIARHDRLGNVIFDPIIDRVTEIIRGLQIDVMIVDPFVSTHHVAENSNDEMDRVVKRWAQVANDGNCAIELVHHSRKTNGNEVTVEDSRGASAVVAGVRSARALNPMSKEEAEKFGLEDRRFRFFRVDDGKANLAPRAEAADWHELVSVDLDNGGPFDEGDSIGVVTRFEPPALLDGITRDLTKQCMIALAGKKMRRPKGLVPGRDDSINAGLVVQTITGKSKRQASHLIEMWINNGALEVVEGPAKKNGHVPKWLEVVNLSEWN